MRVAYGGNASASFEGRAEHGHEVVKNGRRSLRTALLADGPRRALVPSNRSGVHDLDRGKRAWLRGSPARRGCTPRHRDSGRDTRPCGLGSCRRTRPEKGEPGSGACFLSAIKNGIESACCATMPEVQHSTKSHARPPGPWWRGCLIASTRRKTRRHATCRQQGASPTPVDFAERGRPRPMRPVR